MYYHHDYNPSREIDFTPFPLIYNNVMLFKFSKYREKMIVVMMMMMMIKERERERDDV